MKEVDIAWFAGLMEGEGSFLLAYDTYPLLSIQLTDLDVLEKVQSLFGGRIHEHTVRHEHYKRAWKWVIRHPTEYVIELMQQLKPYMGIRRSKKITECVACGQRLLIDRLQKKGQRQKIKDKVYELDATGLYTHRQIAHIVGYERSHVTRILNRYSNVEKH